MNTVNVLNVFSIVQFSLSLKFFAFLWNLENSKKNIYSQSLIFFLPFCAVFKTHYVLSI